VNDEPVPDHYARSIRSMAKGTTITLVGTGATYLFSFLSRVVVAKAYSHSDWGEFNIGVALASLVSTVALLGLQQSITRSIPTYLDVDERRSVITWAVIYSVVVGAVATAIMYLLAPQMAAGFHNASLTIVFQILSVSVGFTVVATVLAGVFRGFEDVLANAVFVQVLQPLLFLGLMVFGLTVGLGFRNFKGVLEAYTIGWAVAGFGLGIYTLGRLPRYMPGFRFRRQLPKRDFWTYSISLWGVSSLSFVTAYFDTIILGIFWPATTVGQYSVAMTLARVFLLANATTAFIFLPITASHAREKRYDTIQGTFVAATRWIVLLVFPLFLLFVFDPSLSIRAVFGVYFVPASPFLVIIGTAGFLSIAVGPVNAALAGIGYSRLLLISTGLSAALNVGLSLTLIPKFAGQGASYAWGVSRLAYPLPGIIFLYRDYKITAFSRSFLRPLLVATAVGAPLFVWLSFYHFPYWSVVPFYFVGTALFVGAILVTRGIDPSDFLLLKSAERWLGRDLGGVRHWLERFTVVPGGE
jgi:O-antigen/teichoic acid export membrane protein